MKPYLLLEGNSDRAFIRRLLPPEILLETTIVTAGERSNITSMARSLMVARNRPLALIADADSVDNDTIQQRLQTLQELVCSSTANVPCKVILAVPEIETWYFQIPEALERLSGKKLSAELRELGRLRPKQVLTQLFKDQVTVPLAQLADKLSESEIEKLREYQPTKELIDFLREQVNQKAEAQSA